MQCAALAKPPRRFLRLVSASPGGLGAYDDFVPEAHYFCSEGVEFGLVVGGARANMCVDVVCVDLLKEMDQ